MKRESIRLSTVEPSHQITVPLQTPDLTTQPGVEGLPEGQEKWGQNGANLTLMISQGRGHCRKGLYTELIQLSSAS